MKKIFILILTFAMVLAMFGCTKSSVPNVDISGANEADEGSTSASDNGTDGESGSDSSDPGGMSESEFNSIDWNTDTYSTYYKVVSDEAVIHYWNCGETALMIVPDTLMYVSGGESLVLDLKTGETSEGYGAAFIPQSASPPTDSQSPKYSDFTGVEIFEDADMYVFTFDVEGGTTSYYVDNSLVCAGWTYDSAEGSATYILNDTLSFEAVVDDIFREYADGTTSGGDDKYADVDGDGYSDWNEGRKPSKEEFDHLTELWKSEGLTGAEYFAEIDELMGEMINLE